MDKNRYFLYGGFTAVSLYAALLYLLFFRFSFFDSPVTYTPNLQSYIEVSFAQNESPKESKSTEVKVSNEEVTPQGAQEKVNLNSLFESVDSKKISDEKKKEDNRAEILSRLKNITKVQPTQTQKSSSLVQNIDIAKSSIKFSAQSNDVKNAYFDNVYKIIASRYRPTSEDSNHKCVVVLSITRVGRLENFNISKSSGDKLFDIRFMKFLDSLKGVDFGVNSRDVEIQFTFKIED
jgi:hypothetical protein